VLVPLVNGVAVELWPFSSGDLISASTGCSTLESISLCALRASQITKNEVNTKTGMLTWSERCQSRKDRQARVEAEAYPPSQCEEPREAGSPLSAC
jgi:hypothetical protein